MRVNNKLAMTRALGDLSLKRPTPYIVAEPYIVSVPLTPGSTFFKNTHTTHMSRKKKKKQSKRREEKRRKEVGLVTASRVSRRGVGVSQKHLCRYLQETPEVLLPLFQEGVEVL